MTDLESLRRENAGLRATVIAAQERANTHALEATAAKCERDIWQMQCEEANDLLTEEREWCDALTVERDRLADRLRDSRHLWVAEVQRTKASERTVAALREALAWYADPDNYRRTAVWGDDDRPEAPPLRYDDPIMQDRGERARAALAAAGKEGA